MFFFVVEVTDVMIHGWKNCKFGGKFKFVSHRISAFFQKSTSWGRDAQCPSFFANFQKKTSIKKLMIIHSFLSKNNFLFLYEIRMILLKKIHVILEWLWWVFSHCIWLICLPKNNVLFQHIISSNFELEIGRLFWHRALKTQVATYYLDKSPIGKKFLSIIYYQYVYMHRKFQTYLYRYIFWAHYWRHLWSPNMLVIWHII